MRAGYEVTRRDRFACWLANKALLIATPKYRAFVAVTSRHGLDSLVQTSGVACLSVRPISVGGEAPPIFCDLLRGHEGAHMNRKGEW